MSGKSLGALRELKSCPEGARVSFKARVLRSWEVGGLRMCLVGDESALTRVELGEAVVREGRSYEFPNVVVHVYPGGWRSASVSATSGPIPLDRDISLTQDEAYIERTYKILSGVQRKKGRAAGRVPPWRHPAGAKRDET